MTGVAAAHARIALLTTRGDTAGAAAVIWPAPPCPFTSLAVGS